MCIITRVRSNTIIKLCHITLLLNFLFVFIAKVCCVVCYFALLKHFDAFFPRIQRNVFLFISFDVSLT